MWKTLFGCILRNMTIENVPESTDNKLLQTSLKNPLVGPINNVLFRITDYKEAVKAFYFEVVLSRHKCQKCGGGLKMSGKSECSCECGNRFDPTLAFQTSSCCEASLKLKTFHYACSKCQRTVPSQFLFDERLFDSTYFKEKMQESRRKKQEKREQMRKILAESRSGALQLTNDLDFNSIPGLFSDLDSFVGEGKESIASFLRDGEADFDIEAYRSHILSLLSWDRTYFSAIKPLSEDLRQDRISTKAWSRKAC